jgi:glycosyltransferase involved in cell wall biosynthesis
MQTIMVIPSYWARPESTGWQEGDFIYDHPTPLNQPGTLGRTIASLGALARQDFELIVLACPSADDITSEVEEKVAAIIAENAGNTDVKISVFGPSGLSRIHSLLSAGGKDEFNDLLSLYGYSNIRNLCQFLPFVAGADVSLLIDDDEVFEDSRFMEKAGEFIGGEHEGAAVDLVAGYYLQPDGDYLIHKEQSRWARVWGQYDAMNRAFRQVIGSGPRLKETSFVFGGNMLIHRDVTRRIPFDPLITRGEDIDFLINAKMFGYRFYLDNLLAIKHLPPPKAHLAWRQHREDIARFLYERAKLSHQQAVAGMKEVSAAELDPYPGRFLREDLEKLVTDAAQLLAGEYRARDENGNAREALANIEFARAYGASVGNPFQTYCDFQRRWQELMSYCENPAISGELGQIIHA